MLPQVVVHHSNISVLLKYPYRSSYEVNRSFFTSQPIIEFLILRSLPAAHHGEVCDYQSSVGSYRSQYITISSNFTDAFLPSSLHNTSIRQSFHLLYYRRCLIAGMYPSEAIIVASQCLSKR